MSERVMLIVWKWLSFRDKHPLITPEYLQNKGFDSAAWNIAQTENQLFDTFSVVEERPDGSRPSISPTARVVRTCINNKIGDTQNACFFFLEQLIEHFKNDNNQVFVFLHRSNGFSNHEVQAVLQVCKADKCFLFGGSRDYIYRNLLDDDGNFYSQSGPPLQLVANENEKQVYQIYFERVWAYYQHEFYTKIFELKQDLLSYFYARFPGDESWTNQELQRYLKQSKLLHLRVHSFMNDTSHCLESEEKQQLSQYGRENHKSYEFDDCFVNLAQKNKLEKEYETISKLLSNLFHEKSDFQKARPLRDWLRQIENGFANLLGALKQAS
ncbi:MAG: hypothetical protein AAFN93_05970 [Bacteroidota bacterium]